MTLILLNNLILQPLFYLLAVVLLFLSRWQTQGRGPDIPKYVLIAAPHTSNWDFVFFLLIIFKLRLPVYWMGKDSMFRWPFQGLLKRLGGIGPVFQPTGDMEADMADIRSFYSGISGRYPQPPLLYMRLSKPLGFLILPLSGHAFFSGICDMIYSERAVMVRLGFTPRLTDTTDPSAT